MSDKTPEQTSPAPAVQKPDSPVTTNEAADNTANKKGAEKKETPAPKVKKRPASRRPVSKLAVLALFISLLTLGALAVTGLYTWNTLVPAASQTIESADTVAGHNWVTNQINLNNQAVESTLNKTISTVETRTNEVTEQSDRLVSRIDNLDRRLIRLQGADRNDWKLAEAEYLMRLANQRLLTMHDLKSAKTLLTQADMLLVAVDEYGLFNVRQALAEDLAALRATPQIDINGAWITLNALANRVDRLPVLAPTTSLKNTPKDSAVTTEEPDTINEVANEQAESDSATWDENLKSSLAMLTDEIVDGAETIQETFARQFRIRKIGHDQVPALLPAKQEVYLRQNLRLMLEQAQVALLQGRTQVFHDSVVKTQKWLKTWFINDSAEMKAIQASLAKLAVAPAEQPIPEINRSLTSLKAYIENKVEQHLPVQPVKKEAKGNKTKNPNKTNGEVQL